VAPTLELSDSRGNHIDFNTRKHSTVSTVGENLQKISLQNEDHKNLE
jgi:hypothetical protein